MARHTHQEVSRSHSEPSAPFDLLSVARTLRAVPTRTGKTDRRHIQEVDDITTIDENTKERHERRKFTPDSGARSCGTTLFLMRL